MNKLIFLLCLLAGSALADSTNTVTRGSFLKKRVYQTYATATYYVDPTGSDSNACTASGTSACATFAGVLAKLPQNIKHNVTVNIAVGAYAAAFTNTSYFHIDPGVTLTIAGTMSPFTVATGTNTGTVTSETGTGSLSPAVITDSTQTWTTNDLRGAFMTFGGGAQSGLSYPIISNTATTATVMLSAAASAGIGTSYTITKPGSTFISSSGATFQGFTGHGTVLVKGVWIERTASGTVITTGSNHGVLTEFSEDLVRTTFSSTGFFNSSTALTVRRSYVETGGTCINNVNGTPRMPANVSGVNLFLNTTGTIGSALFASSLGASAVLAQSYARSAGSGTPNAVITLAGANMANSSFPTIYVECLNSGNTVGIGTPPLAAGAFIAFNVSAGNNGATWIKGCGTGMRATGPGAILAFNGIVFDTVTTAASVTGGGRIHFLGSTPTFTGVTNELSLDGTAYTFSTLTGLPSPQVITNSYGSTIIR